MPDLSIPCGNCGQLNAAGSLRCAVCGHPVSITPPVTADHAPMPPVPPGASSGVTTTGLLAPGTVLNGRYHILGLAGTGGMGAVYRAADLRLGERPVALKEMREYGLTPEQVLEATETFHREARLLAGLHHPSLPNIHDHFNAGGRWYLVMEFIDGETLQQRLARLGTPGLPVTEVLRLGDQICAVIEFLHRQTPPVIFRDLKPGNIMITPAGQLYLIDFGIARLFKPGQATDTISLGSAGYAAPEQYGRSQTTVQSDIYSLGITLHQLLTGQDPSLKPFALPPIRPYNPETPAQLETLVLNMVQIDESRRPASIAQVRQSLRQIAQLISTVRLARPAAPPYLTSPVPSLPVPSIPVPPPGTRLPPPPPIPSTGRKQQRRHSRTGLAVFAILAGAIAVLCAAAVICSAASAVIQNQAASANATATAAVKSTVTSQQQTLAADHLALTRSVATLAQDSNFDYALAFYARDWKQMQADYKQEQTDFKRGCAVAGNAHQVQSVDTGKIMADLSRVQSDDVVLASMSGQTSKDVAQVQTDSAALAGALRAGRG